MELFECAEEILWRHYENDDADIKDMCKDTENKAFRMLYDANLLKLHKVTQRVPSQMCGGPVEAWTAVQNAALSSTRITGDGLALCEDNVGKRGFLRDYMRRKNTKIINTQTSYGINVMKLTNIFQEWHNTEYRLGFLQGAISAIIFSFISGLLVWLVQILQS